MDQFKNLVNTILNCQNAKGSAFVAISGLGGSGKTTLTNQLLNVLPEARVIRVDDFYKTEEERKGIHHSESVISNCFDWDRLETTIRLFQEGKAVCYQTYNWAKNTRGGWAELDPKSITLLEGIYSFQDRFIPHYDIAVWVDAPYNIRLDRITKRDEDWKKQWHATWMAQDDRYFQSHRPDLKAHIVYSNY